MSQIYFDVFDAISFAVKYLQGREDRPMRPLIMDAFALAGLAESEDEFIAALLFFTCGKSQKARHRLSSLPIDKEIREILYIITLHTDDFIPDPFGYRIDLIKRRTESSTSDERYIGFVGLTVFSRHVAIRERQLLLDIAYYQKKEKSVKMENIIRNLKSSLEGVRSEKNRLIHAFGEDCYKRLTSCY